MLDNRKKSKIKNDKIGRWRVELSTYKFDIIYRTGSENYTFSPVASKRNHLTDLKEIHKYLCHPGITLLSHFVQTKNLTYTLAVIKTITTKGCRMLRYLPRNIRGQSSRLY